MKNALWLCFFLALTLAARWQNHGQVFVEGQIYFVDPDCYSRMTRAREVFEHPGTIIRHQDFENYPQGVTSHATAPMDYLIAALALVLRPFTKNHLDLAGAVISPILGLLTTAFLAFWARELNQRFRKLMLLLVSLSPILVHGTSLGRPDHQSLLIFLLAVALGAELAMARAPSVRWGVIGGAAWALGLWVSLYEPLVLMVTIFLTKVIFYRSSLLARERWPGHAVFFTILAIAFGVEGWHVAMPDETVRQYFPYWTETIGEMSGWRVLAPMLGRWVGLGLFAAPLLLIARLRETKRSLLLLALLAVTFGCTVAQVRWGYFFALVFAMSLPWQLSLFKQTWPVWCVFLLSLWPVMREWDERLFPGQARETELAMRRWENLCLRDAAERLRVPEKIPVLAPWWLSPALAYWSGQPCVAGSSHESLAGIVDTARFYDATDPAEARAILEKRGVRAVLACEPSRVVDTSAVLLSRLTPRAPLAETLWQRPHSAPPFLRDVYDNPLFKIFAVSDAALPREP